MSKKILIFILILFFALFQIGFIDQFFTGATLLNGILIFTIFLCYRNEKSYPVMYLLITGLLLDFFSLYFFGLYTLSLLITAGMIFYVQKQYINQKTYFSLIIVGIASTVFYSLLIFLGSNLAYLLDISDFRWTLQMPVLSDLAFQVIINTAALVVLLYGTRWYYRQFKPQSYIKL